MRQLSFEAAGCRLVQDTLQEVDSATASELVSELSDCVWEASQSKHANFVLQKAIEVGQSRFVADKLRNKGVEVSCHKYGYKVIKKLVENTANDAWSAALLAEVLQKEAGLCRDEFGHYIVQSILEYGTDAQRKQVITALREELALPEVKVNERVIKSNESACHVIESALIYCSDGSAQGQAAIFHDLVSGVPDCLAKLAKYRFGRKLLEKLGLTAC